MRTGGYACGRSGVALVAASLVFLFSCATTTRPQLLRTFFLPPAHPTAVPEETPLEPPHLSRDLYAGEAPNLTTSLPSLPKPSAADFLIKTSEDRFAAGKRAFQEGRAEDARREFDRAVET